MDSLMLFVSLSAIMIYSAGALLSPSVAGQSDLDEFYETVASDAILSDKFNFIMDNMPDNYLEEIVALGAVLGYDFTTYDVKKSLHVQGSYVCLPLGCWNNVSFG